jgi:hypothetical protein
MKGINTAGQALHPPSAAASAASRGVLNPSVPHSLNHARASTVAISLRSSITPSPAGAKRALFCRSPRHPKSGKGNRERQPRAPRPKTRGERRQPGSPQQEAAMRFETPMGEGTPRYCIQARSLRSKLHSQHRCAV